VPSARDNTSTTFFGSSAIDRSDKEDIPNIKYPYEKPKPTEVGLEN
jgi:hypothetical protein